MREIKFRVWDLDEKEFIYSDSMSGESWGCHVLDNYELKNNQQQYTGLKDKNGKEIYEGDICKYINGEDEKYSIMQWNAERARFYLMEFAENPLFLGGIMYLFHTFSPSDEKRNIEVISNIYETPELIVGLK